MRKRYYDEWVVSEEELKHMWVTSDTHFGHEFIRTCCFRPFDSIEEMDKAMIDNWNNVVQPGDIVLHLGDFSWYDRKPTNDILNKLVGNKYLIMGNHDKVFKQNKLSFTEVMLQLQLVVRETGQHIFLNHYPFLCYAGTYSKQKDINLFGHVYSGPPSDGLDLPRLANLFPSQYDVGVDNNNFTPLNLYELIKKINEDIGNK